jgi:hypothetical protein
MKLSSLKKLVIRKTIIVGLIIISGVIFGIINGFTQAAITPVGIDSSMQVNHETLPTWYSGAW